MTFVRDWVYDLSVASIPSAKAEGVDEEFFHVTCPACGTLTLVSRYERDGSLCDCTACWTGQFFFEAGDFAGSRLR